MKLSLHRLVLFVSPILTGLFAIQTSHAQHLSLRTGDARWEVGFNIGPTFFLGDLGGNAGEGTRFIKDINLELTKMMKGGFIAFYPAEWIGFRAAASSTRQAPQPFGSGIPPGTSARCPLQKHEHTPRPDRVRASLLCKPPPCSFRPGKFVTPPGMDRSAVA